MQIVDVARGCALVAMIVYHFAWDLSFLGFIATDVGREPLWRAFAASIAGSFLFLTGVGLVLAQDAGRGWGAWSRRLGKIALAAAAVSLGTYVAFPDAFVYFGILHMIAVGAILATPFLKAPPLVSALCAAAVFVAPQFVASQAFDTRWLAWIGFARTPPPTVDFEPVFPWFALVLAGVVAARLAVDAGALTRLAAIGGEGRLSRPLAAMGRRSLLIYLAHQPILLAALYPLSLALPPSTAAFRAPCVASCAANGADPALCERACLCVAERLIADGRDELLSAPVAEPADHAMIAEIGRACFREALTSDPPAPNE